MGVVSKFEGLKKALKDVMHVIVVGLLNYQMIDFKIGSRSMLFTMLLLLLKKLSAMKNCKFLTGTYK